LSKHIPRSDVNDTNRSCVSCKRLQWSKLDYLHIQITHVRFESYEGGEYFR